VERCLLAGDRRGQALVQSCACMHRCVMYMHSVVGRAEGEEEYRWCSGAWRRRSEWRFHGISTEWRGSQGTATSF
jgi:hypothetical protein